MHATPSLKQAYSKMNYKKDKKEKKMISFKIKLHMRHIKCTSLVMRDLELFLSQLTLIYYHQNV
jgi:hypothetical protein